MLRVAWSGRVEYYFFPIRAAVKDQSREKALTSGGL